MHKYILIISALLCTTQAFAFPQAGEESVPASGYTLVNPPQPLPSGTKIEVLEFFIYGCSHCFNLHPVLKKWKGKMPKDVVLTPVPVTFDSAGEAMAYTFYALESIGKQKQLHDDLYHVWNVRNMDILNEAAATDFVVQQGVDRQKFSAAYHAPSTRLRVMNSQKLMKDYNIRSTPSLVVDGKYLISDLQPQEMMRVLDTVIAKARKERAAAKKH